MTLFEALIIYLSAGAPFGVLVFFSKRSSIGTAGFYSILATAAWPIFAGQRVFRSLSVADVSRHTSTEISPLEVLLALADEIPGESAELFEIAGHPNPWLATNCYARSRKRVVRSHIDRLQATPPSIVQEFEITHIPEYSRSAASAISNVTVT